MGRRKTNRAVGPPTAVPVKPIAPATQTTRLRLWVVRLAMVVLSPLIFFLLVEISLRLGGFGKPTSFFLTRQVDGKNQLTQNDWFGWRFFGPELSRSPRRMLIPASKSPDTCRIFVLGESAAFGDPQPDFGVSRMLEVLLSDRFPGVRFEVVNAAMTAINSHVLLPIARDCARQKGDLWVIYMGNNEVVGPFGTGTVFGPKAPPLPLIRASLAAKETRTAQMLERLIEQVGAKRGPQEWGGLMMFLENQVRHDDARMERVYSHFEQNLADMLKAAVRHDTKVILCSVAGNLRDCAPFGSQHRAGLSESQLQEWERLWQAAINLQNQGKNGEAHEFFQRAEEIDGQFAELQFRWGHALSALGQGEAAQRRFRLARDYDTLRFRTDSRLNELIRKAASGGEKAGIYYLDVEGAIASRSPQGLPGHELFYEHVHFTFEGNYWLARSIAETAEKALPDWVSRRSAGRPWLSASDCAQRLAWTSWDEYQTLQTVLARISDPPFTRQSTHHSEYERLRKQKEELLPAVGPAGLRQADEKYARALERSPDDWVLHQGQARLRKKLGNLSGAVASWRRVLQLLGPSSDLHVQIGLLLNESGQPDLALKEFERALSLDPRQVDALNGQGMALAKLQRHSEAVPYFEKALRLRPHSIDAHLNLSLALKALGNTEAAAQQFRLGLARKPLNSETLILLGKACMQEGLKQEAVTNFSMAVQLDPTEANGHFCLAMAYISGGRRAEAEKHFAEAVRLNPNFAEARVGLGIEMGRRGEDSVALEHFAAATRLKPEFVEAHLNLGVALLRQQRQKEAIREFMEVLRLDPSNATARKMLKAADEKRAVLKEE